MAQSLSWGKCTIWISKLNDSGVATTWKKIPTPVEGSTTLTTSKGDKKEAKVEGGLYEGIKYNKNTYALEFEIRAVKGRDKIAEDVDGVIEGEWGLKLQPEDATVEGIQIDRGILSMEPSYSTEDGTKWKYTMDALIPLDESNSVKFEVTDDPTTESAII